MDWKKFVYGIEVGQRYRTSPTPYTLFTFLTLSFSQVLENTTLGIPALIQSEGLHGFTNNGTIWPSPIGLAASFDPDLLQKAAATISAEAEGLGINHIFAPVLDLGRELRWGRVEEGFGEDPFLTGEMALAYVNGLQNGRRRNTSSTAVAKMAATWYVSQSSHTPPFFFLLYSSFLPFLANTLLLLGHLREDST
jgi:beta-glucosidase